MWMIARTCVLLNVMSIYQSIPLGDYDYVVPCDSPSTSLTPTAGDHSLSPFAGECPMFFFVSLYIYIYIYIYM
uniref:Secreted protein n=1 Tax=Heterorhabditis bacteriophora TaxID=37862 RepID=A0A1I7WJ36_HETBA